MTRKITRKINVGPVEIGGGAPVSIQSMTNTPTSDAAATLNQIRTLADAGCQIIRAAVPDEAALEALPEILDGTPIPFIADIHFNYKLALGAIRAGVHAVRINPGNIGSAEHVRKVAEAAGEAGIPIRVGANSGSLPKGLTDRLRSEGVPEREIMPRALSEAALAQADLLRQYGFEAIKVSLKSSSVVSTVSACRYFSERSDLPLHIGVTEAGTPANGIIKSAVGIGTLLMEGIGDTLRVSLTATPEREIAAALRILEAAGLREARPELVSCPTCGRTRIDLERLATEVEQYLDMVKSGGKRIGLKKIAVMGCVVNGPGEASDADLGLAGGIGTASVFEKGVILATLPEREALALLKRKIDESLF